MAGVEDSNSKVHWSYYFITGVSSLFVALDCMVNAYYYLYVNHIWLPVIVFSALSGGLLNQPLYWEGAPKVLDEIKKKPSKLLEPEYIISLFSGLMMFGLTMNAYTILLKTSLFSSVLMYLPWGGIPLALLFSTTLLLSTFTLIGDALVKSKNSDRPDVAKSRFLQWVGKGIAFVTSLALSFTCFFASSSYLGIILGINFPTLLLGIFSLGLFYGEFVFNNKHCSNFFHRVENLFTTGSFNNKKKPDNIGMMFGFSGFTILFIIANSAANGFISLGDYAKLPELVKWLLVSMGAINSVAVMYGNFNGLEWKQLLPKKKEDQLACIGMSGLCLMGGVGLYALCMPAVSPVLLIMSTYVFIPATIISSCTWWWFSKGDGKVNGSNKDLSVFSGNARNMAPSIQLDKGKENYSSKSLSAESSVSPLTTCSIL